MNITYEIVVYETKVDYFNRQGVIADDGIENKSEALKTGKELTEWYEVVKVQSNDREFIELFTQKNQVV